MQNRNFFDELPTGQMSTFEERLTTALSPTYEIERELTGAGMSQVLVATDVALGRRIVTSSAPKAYERAVGMLSPRTGLMCVRGLQIAAIACLALATATQRLIAQKTDSVWTIKAGSYAGQTVVIDRSAAVRRSAGYWRMSNIAGQKRIVGWNPSRLPARVAFRQGRGISAADSIAFWDILQRMHVDIGMRLFEPASLSPDSDPDDLIVIDTKPMTSAEGLTLVTWASSGSLYDARVYLRERETLHSPRVVTHEMMHALGFGHTSAWTSVMNGYGGGVRGLTPEDVAYAQLALESRGVSEREDMWARLALAVERDPQPADLKDGYTPCPTESAAPFAAEYGSRSRPWSTMGALTAVMSCSNK